LQEKAALLEKFKDTFGYWPLVEAPIKDPKDRRRYTDIERLNKEHVGKEVWIRGRIHVDRPVSANLLFFTLRHRQGTVQVVIAHPPELVKFAKGYASTAVNDQ